MNPLSELKPGDHISYDYIVGLNNICAGQGEVVEISEEAIRVRKKSGYFDTLWTRDIERNETRILGYEPKKEDEDMGKQRGEPDYKKLRKVYQESGYNISAVQREFTTHWNTARRWLFDAGLIDEINKPTAKAKENEPKQMFSEEEETPMETAIKETSKHEEALDSVDAGKKDRPKRTDEKCRNCGRIIPGDEVKYWHRGWMCSECAGAVLDASLKSESAVEAESHVHHISAEPPSAPQDELAPCGINGMSCAQTPVREPAGSQYEPEDNDYQDEIEQVITAAANRGFERKGFVLEVIANIIELAEVRRTPAELTVELIDAVLAVA